MFRPSGCCIGVGGIDFTLAGRAAVLRAIPHYVGLLSPKSDLGVSDKLTGTWGAAIPNVGSLAFPFSATITGKTYTCTCCVGSFILTRQ